VRILPETSLLPPEIISTALQKVHGTDVHAQSDVLAVEEPLEIRLDFDAEGRRVQRSISVTMRTPGQDVELAAGFLLTEGIVSVPQQIADIEQDTGPDGRGNVARVELRRGVPVDLGRLERHFYTASSCGVCGKKSIAAVQVCQHYPLGPAQPIFDATVIHRLPLVLRSAQAVFDRTGGLHAAGLFDRHGELLCLREDVGRHNAVDKLIGTRFLANRLPCSDCLLLVSGRASFELVQKALMAGIPILAAVGAPSSLAVELARDRGMTLLGFVRHDGFNLYTGPARIRAVSESTRTLTCPVPT
jgi:FdhD protein